MRGNPSLWGCTFVRVLVLGVAVVLAPLPALAGDGPQAPHGLQASAQKIAANEKLAASATNATQDQGSTGPNLESASFFKSKVGVAVLAVVGAGIGYAVYSSQHDRIHSVARQGQ